MPMFRVELHRRILAPGEQARNPFLGGMPSLAKRVDMSVRRWEFEATDEAEARALLADAHKRDLPGVRGYNLRSIVQVPETAEASRE